MRTYLPSVRSAEPDHGHPAESPGIILDHGVDEMRRSDGDVKHSGPVDAGLDQDIFHRRLDALCHVWCGRGLAGGQHPARFSVDGIDIQDRRIGVGPTDVDADSVHASLWDEPRCPTLLVICDFRLWI